MSESSAQARRLLPRLALTLTLPLVILLAILSLSAQTAHLPLAAGPVCFHQNGHPVCVERPGSDARTTSDVAPQALLTTLLAGPTSDEQARGIESALPPKTRVVSVQTAGQAITVRLAFPASYLIIGSHSPKAFNAPASEAIVEQLFQTLLPLGYRDLHVWAQDPTAPKSFQPLSAYLPSVTVAPKNAGAPPRALDPRSGQPPVEPLGHPPGALSGKTIYVSAGHGWQWNGYNWRTQRPPYPDGTTGYVGPIIEDHNNAEVVNQYLLRYLQNAGADVWSARERDLNGSEQILDDEAPHLEATGDWQTVEGEGYSGRYLQTDTSLTPTAAVTWTSEPLFAAGLYALYVWYAPGADRTVDAHYTVHHAGGTTPLTLGQQHHGQTWRYLGSFPLRAGEKLTVSLDNQSTTPGRVVVADAFRLGGGRFDDADLRIYGGPVTTSAPYAPDEPWWEIGAFYHVQRLGLNPDDLASFNDVSARPLWAKWEHANSGDDALFVSWHSNGYNGHNDSIWGTMSFIHSERAAEGSAALRHAIHTELVNDARVGWDPAWRDLGEASRDLGELRELWDNDPANALPGALIEIAYHDHVTDTDALKDPRFALLSARAVYQGIVKYFETRDGIDLTLLPEPPTGLTLRNAGPGQVKVSWRPSPTDTVGLVGDAATSYRVYTSHDGFVWDEGQPTLETHYTLTDVQPNELLFVRVTAVNAGGESFPTPVLAARASANGIGQILLVQGFDRIDRHGLIFENDPTEGINARLFPDQINSFDYVIQHAETISLPFDSADNKAVAEGDLNLALYSIVDWILGEESSVDHTFDAAEQAALASYLDGEGALFVSGAEVGWDLVSWGNGLDFYHNYLGADMVGDDAGTYVVTPTTGGIFAGLGPFDFRASYDVDYPDQLSPRGNSVAALDYLGGAGGIAALQYHAGGCRRVVYLGFPFETIDPAQRPAVMGRVLNYLGSAGCLANEPQTAITTPFSGQAFNSVPGFAGTAIGFNPIERVEVLINDPGGRSWDGQDWISASGWLTAAGSNAWQYLLPISLTQGEHRLQARAWDTTTLADTTPAFASFTYDTLSPTTPTLIAPAQGITLTATPSSFSWHAPPNDDGSDLGYNLQIDQRVLTQAITRHVPSGLLATGIHTWRVRAFDAAGNRSAWTPTWTFYVANYSIYLPQVLKNPQADPPPTCSDVISNGGFETEGGWIINNTPVPAAYVTEQRHSGERSVRLGLVPPMTGTGSTSYSSIDQTIPLPKGISATLSFWLYPINDNNDVDDVQYIGLYDEEGVWETHWMARLDTQTWSLQQIDLTPYLGQVVNLRFSVKNDGDDDRTALFIDDVYLEVCGQ